MRILCVRAKNYKALCETGDVCYVLVPIPQSLLDFHHAHKHGPHATYGQAPAEAPDDSHSKHSAALQEAAVAAALKK